MPRSGGDYVFISRVSRARGFVASFLFFVAILISAGSGSYWAFSEAGTQLSFRRAGHRRQWDQVPGDAITPGVSGSPATLMAVGIVILAIGAVLVYGGQALPAGGLLLLRLRHLHDAAGDGIFLTSSHADFVNAYNAYFQGGVTKVFSDALGIGLFARASLANLGAVVPSSS